ncbi:MAG: oligosaccharide flippase family protein [Acidimicrobiales bacterium]
MVDAPAPAAGPPDSAGGSRVAKNVVWLTASQLFTWSLALVLAFVLPRHLGASAVGRLYFAQSLWALASAAVAFGTDTAITKAVARDASTAVDLTGRATAARVALLAVAWPTLVGVLALAGADGEKIRLVAVIGLGSSIGLLIGPLRAALQGVERMHVLSIGDMTIKAVLVVAVVALVALDRSVVVVAAAWVLSAACGAAVVYAAGRRATPVRLWARPAMVRATLGLGLPYLLLEGGRILYQQIDTVVISMLVDDRTVGWYGTADQIYRTMFFVPSVVLAALFPVFARLPTRPVHEVEQVLGDCVAFTYVVAVPLGLGLVVLGPRLATFVFGDGFAGTGRTLAVFGAALVPTYLATLLGYVATAMDRVRVWVRLMFGAAAATFVLDLLLVPWADRRFGNGAIGGALSYVLTELVIVAVGASTLGVRLVRAPLIAVMLKATVAGAVMSVLVWLSRDLPLLVPIAIGAVVYPVAVLVSGAVDARRRELLRDAVRSLRAPRPEEVMSDAG